MKRIIATFMALAFLTAASPAADVGQVAGSSDTEAASAYTRAADHTWLWGLLYPGMGQLQQGNARRGAYFAGQATVLLLLTGLAGMAAIQEHQPPPPNRPPQPNAYVATPFFYILLIPTIGEWLWSAFDAALLSGAGENAIQGASGLAKMTPGDLLLSGRVGFGSLAADIGGEAAWRCLDNHDLVARGDRGIMGTNLGVGWRWFPWGRRPMETYLSASPLVQLVGNFSTSVYPGVGFEVGQELWYGSGVVAAQGFAVDIGMMPALRFVWRFGGVIGGESFPIGGT